MQSNPLLFSGCHHHGLISVVFAVFKPVDVQSIGHLGLGLDRDLFFKTTISKTTKP